MHPHVGRVLLLVIVFFLVATFLEVVNLFLVLVRHLLHLLSPFQIVHVLEILGVLHVRRRHGEGLLVEERDDALLTQHQLNHALSFVLVELILLVEGTARPLRVGALAS